MRAPLPTVIIDEWGRRVDDGRLPEEDDMCDVAPVSKYHSEELGGGVGAPAEWSAA